MAAARVFNIAEVLEMILCHTNVIDCAKLQRTNSFFHATIKNSRLIRRKMFLDLDPAPPTNDSGDSGYKGSRLEFERSIARVHPALGTLSVKERRGMEATVSKNDIMGWRNGPWQKMSLTEPPYGVVFVDGPGGLWYSVGMRTLGDLEKNVMELDRYPGDAVRLFINATLIPEMILGYEDSKVVDESDEEEESEEEEEEEMPIVIDETENEEESDREDGSDELDSSEEDFEGYQHWQSDEEELEVASDDDEGSDGEDRNSEGGVFDEEERSEGNEGAEDSDEDDEERREDGEGFRDGTEDGEWCAQSYDQF